MSCIPSLSVPRSLAGVVVAAWILATAASAEAQVGFGVRAGVSADPDQFVFGVHYNSKPLFDHLNFRPNADVGVGDDLTTFTANFEFAYWIPIQKKPWSVYVGGGPALVVYHHGDNSGDSGHTDTEPGFNLLVGFAHRGGLFAEVKAGLIDSPAVKFIIGYTFR
jgi:hypothetical protein